MSQSCFKPYMSKMEILVSKLSLKSVIPAGVVAHSRNLGLWEAEVGGTPEVRNLRPGWPTW